MKKYLFLIFALFIFIPKVNADTLPVLNINTTKYQYYDDLFYSTLTIKDFANLIEFASSDYYNIAIYQNLDNSRQSSFFTIYLLPKNTTQYTFGLSYYHLQVGSRAHQISLNYNNLYRFTFNSAPTTSGQNIYSAFMSCYQNNSCPSSNTSYYSDDNILLGNFNNTSTLDTIYSLPNSTNLNTSIIDLNTNRSLYYSNINILYNFNSNPSVGSSFNNVFSGLIINNNTITSNFTYIPSYKELYNPSYQKVPYNPEEWLSSINIGNITDLYNFRFNLEFDFDNYEPINNMSAVFYVYGRKNMGTYYTYERLDTCSAINNHKLDKQITGKHAIFNYFSQGIYCNNVNYSDYDYFYIDLSTITSGSFTISNLSYSSQGNVVFGKSYHIYDKFNSLPYDYSLFITSNEPSTTASYESNNKYTCANLVDINNLVINSNICVKPGSFGKTTNKGYMIFNMRNYDDYNTDLGILINEDSIVSFGSNGSQDNSEYTYIEPSGNITTNIINNDMVIKNYDDYNVSNYFDLVNNYINDLSIDINNFSNLVQNFYDSAPSFMQITIYTIFILLCSYFVYLMIRK